MMRFALLSSLLVSSAFTAGCGKKDAAPASSEASAKSESAGAVAAQQVPAFDRIVLEEISVPDGPSQVPVVWELPKGTAINEEAPFRIRWKTSEALENSPDDVVAKGDTASGGFHIPVQPAKGATGARLLGDIDMVLCDAETHAVCTPLKREVDITFSVGGEKAPGSVRLPLPAAKS